MTQSKKSSCEYPFDLGSYQRSISTTSIDAELWFNRGLNWLFGYNHEEAAFCFKKALEFDPNCAMAYWGIAYSIGPNYNRPWELFNESDILNTLKIAREACANAIDRLPNASPIEKAIICALPLRYQSDKPSADLYAWSKDYADEMRNVYRQYESDPDVILLFAEAMMNRAAWKLWDIRTGEIPAGADTKEIQEVLENGITMCREKAVDHPGIWHAYIHAMEMSQHPEIALRVADELGAMNSASGHLPHMGTHIYVQCGHYQDVVSWNNIAIQKDTRYWEYAGALNFYSLYRLHNYHFKQYGAMLLGQYKPALEAVQDMRKTVPDALIRMESPPMADFLEAYMSVGTHTYVRFGKWKELIEDPLPEDQSLYCTVTAMNWYGKGIAYANLKQIEKALEAQQKLKEVITTVPGSRKLHNVSAHQILEVAEEMLSGEIEYHRGNYAQAFEHIRKCVVLEDAMPYDEPWAWMMPARHPLGALLSEQGHYREAAQAYEADLGLNDTVLRTNRHPNNVWALLGLHRCYEMLEEMEKAAQIKPQLDLALARADRNIHASCFCAANEQHLCC
ncbi:hypothetical protein [Cupriavidus metallidurans]|uniref:Tetratricopeptide repeat protein n=1 Tax=Cupriavidus metallidurans TaxID=119219 RepID=A0A482J0G2_9BURK|nr:hypothetical protein [Cupriavidus metallidurans]QBP12520.1 hypothetical protein DDF84_022610 [Cupriavidus metallidurans]